MGSNWKWGLTLRDDGWVSEGLVGPKISTARHCRTVWPLVASSSAVHLPRPKGCFSRLFEATHPKDGHCQGVQEMGVEVFSLNP